MLSICLLLCPPSAKACNCIGPDNFFSSLETVIFALSHEARLENYAIVKGVVTGLTNNHKGIKLFVIREYLAHEVDDTVVVWNTDGTDCRADIKGICNGSSDTFIFLLNRIQFLVQSLPDEDTVDYYLSRCGSRHLVVKNDSVFGGYPGTFAFNGFPLKDFEDSLGRFAHRVKALNVEKLPTTGKYPMSIFPNPATTEFTVAGMSGKGAISISDASGRLLEYRSTTEPTNSINVSRFAPGIYTVRASDATRIVQTFKLIK